MNLPQFLKDHENKDSSARVNLFLLLLVTLFVIIYQTMTKSIDHWLIAELLGIIFVYKGYQFQKEKEKAVALKPK